MKAEINAIGIAAAIGMSVIPVFRQDSILSRKAQEACITAGKIYDIAPEFLMSIAEAESSGNPRAENGTCKGLMQVSERWHEGRMYKLGVMDLFCERDNVMVAADYLSELFQKYKDPALVLDIYNGNRKAQENYDKGILSDYAEKILERSAELEGDGAG